VRLLEPARVAVTPGLPHRRWHVGPAIFDGGGGRVELALVLDDRLDATLRASRLRPWALLPGWAPGCDGTLEASFAARGDPDAPEATLHLRSAGLTVGGRAGQLAIDAQQDAGGMRLERGQLQVEGALQAEATGAAPVILGLGGIRALGGVPKLAARVFAQATPGVAPDLPGMPEVGCVEVRGSYDETGAHADLLVRELLVRLPQTDELTRPVPDEIASADAHAEAGPHGWHATFKAGDTGGLSVSAEGTGTAALDPAAPSAFVAALAQDDLIGRVTLEHAELARLSALVPALVRVSGRTSGELRVSGRPLMPRWDGELTLEGASLKARSDLPAIGDIHGKLLLEGTRITIEQLSARMGYSPVTVSGSADLGEFRPAFDLHLNGTNVLLARNQYLRLRADCDLTLHGPLEEMVLAGEVRITDALWSRPVEVLSRLRPSGGHRAKQEGLKLFSIREGPLSTLRFDVGIAALQNFRVRSNVFRGDCSMDLRLAGTGESPLPRGRVWCEDGLLLMPFTTVHVVHAAAVFPPDDPFLPRLEANGEARLKGYDLRVHAEGELPDIEVTVDSDPPLGTSDAMMLLTTGLTGHEREENDSGRVQLTMAGKYLAKEVFQEFSGPGDPDAERGWIDLDRLDISVGQQVSASGQDTIEAEYELTQRFYLHGERDEFDQYNLGLIWRLHRR
jgi:hypothetical protein